MATARFQFHGEIGAFLPAGRRGRRFSYACARAANLKNAIEALGVPHTEVGALRVNGAAATLQRMVREGDEVEVFGPGAPAAADWKFLADAHLGGLARFLRMLGFDTLHEQRLSDREIRRIAHDELRVLLTRDRDLLKCRDIVRGCYVHALKPEAQLAEVAARYGLAQRAAPFTLCLHCNLPLEALEKSAVVTRVPESVALTQESFMHCPGCDRVFWPGSHYARMRSALARIGLTAP